MKVYSDDDFIVPYKVLLLSLMVILVEIFLEMRLMAVSFQFRLIRQKNISFSIFPEFQVTENGIGFHYISYFEKKSGDE